MGRNAKGTAVASVMGDNPLDGEDLLLDALFGQSEKNTEARVRPGKPQHYKVVSISLYNEDLLRLEEMVRELKRRGHYKANKSEIIRYALMQLNVDKFPTRR